VRKAARLASVEPDSNVIPLVAPKQTSDRSIWIAGAFLTIVAVLLFLVLDGRRRALTAPVTTAPAEVSDGMISAPPDLLIPREIDADDYPLDRAPVFRVDTPEFRPAPSPLPSPTRRAVAPPAVNAYEQAYAAPAVTPMPAPTYSPNTYEPPATYDPGLPQDQVEDRPDLEQRGGSSKERAFAARLSNPSTTVPLGTVVPAVLETALDSTGPGGIRAIVSRDVRGFDGTRILIPRGSRIYGEYGAELGRGQNRALIRWTRLVRPDGALIALDSPASDPLGRAGVRGKVDSKFLERFGEALLQSTLDIGTGFATRRVAGDAVIFALPGSNPQISGRASQQVQRTLKVRQGTSVSVFVARDLDFTPVEN
jgi:type IV secretion system protein VirB10